MHRTLLLAFALIPQLHAQELDFEAAAKFSKAEAGLAVLVYHADDLIFEEYQNGHGKDKPQHLFSGTKSFAPIVALIAQEQGLLSLDEPVYKTITEWKGDEQREKITIRHLLDFTSGLEINDREMHSGTDDWYRCAIGCKAISEAGKTFRYGSCHLMVFGELLKRKLANAAKGNDSADGDRPEDFVDYLQLHVLDKIDCKVAHWLRDGEENPALPYGAHMTAREWAKFGLLLLRRGRWGKEQVIPLEHFDECFVGSKAKPVYGLNFWLHGKLLSERDSKIPTDTVLAAGMYNQRLYIIPSKKLVIVRLGRTRAKAKFSDLEFLSELFAH